MANKYEYVKRSVNRRRVWLAEQKQGKPCVDCGIEYPHYVLDWHHLDPATKLFGIGQGSFRNSRAKILEEMAKCVLLCANCHREREYGSFVEIVAE
jgi:hypothetical protein